MGSAARCERLTGRRWTLEPSDASRREPNASSGNRVEAPSGESSREPVPSTSRSGQISRSFPPAERDPEGDTLLSAPAPAQKWETELEDRLTKARQRIDELEARVNALEASARSGAGGFRLPRALWWVAFLLVLALIWLLAGRLHE